MNSPSREARLKAGFSTKEAACRLRVCPSYLLSAERTQDFPLVLARRAAWLYQVSLNAFTPGGGTPKRAKAGEWRSPRPVRGSNNKAPEKGPCR